MTFWWGGQGSDTFVFDHNDWGSDTVRDFEDGLDLIDLSGTSVSSFAELTVTQVGSDVLITFGSATLTLQNMSLSSIDGSDFAF